MQKKQLIDYGMYNLKTTIGSMSLLEVLFYFFMMILVIPYMDAFGIAKWKWNLFSYNRMCYNEMEK